MLLRYTGAHKDFRVTNQSCIPCLTSLGSGMGTLVVDPLYGPTEHGVQIHKCRPESLPMKVTAIAVMRKTDTMGKSSLRKEKDEIDLPSIPKNKPQK